MALNDETRRAITPGKTLESPEIGLVSPRFDANKASRESGHFSARAVITPVMNDDYFQQILAELVRLNSKMDTGFSDVRKEMDTGFAAVRKEMDTGFAAVRKEMDIRFAGVQSEFKSIRKEMATGFADVRKELDDKFGEARKDTAALRLETRTGFNEVRKELKIIREQTALNSEEITALEQRVKKLPSA